MERLIPVLFWGYVSIALVALLFRPQAVIYFLISSLPIEALIESDIYSLPKVLGFLAVLGFLLTMLREKRKVKFNLALLVMYLLLLWGGFSYFWSVSPTSTIMRLGTLLQLLILYFMLINQLRDEKDFSWAMFSLFIGTIIFALFGLMDLSLVLSNNEMYRLAGIAKNANWYFLVSICLVPSLYWTITNTQKKLIKIFGFITLVVLFITSIYTQSRGGLISLGLFLLVFLLLSRRNFSVLILILIIVLVFFQVAPETYLQRFALTGKEHISRFVDLWPAGWMAFQNSPWIGYGLGASDKVLPQFVLTTYVGNIMSVHNALLAIGIDAGIPGIILYLAFVFIPTFQLYKLVILANKVVHKTTLLTTAKLLLAVMVAYMASWFKGGGMEYQKMLWLLVGLEAILASLLSSSFASKRRNLQ